MNKYKNELVANSVNQWIVQKTGGEQMKCYDLFPCFSAGEDTRGVGCPDLASFFSLVTSPSPPPCGYNIREFGCHLGITTSYSLVPADWTRTGLLTQTEPMDAFSRESEIGTKRGQASV